MHCQRIMVRRADWRTTDDRLRKRLGRQERTPSIFVIALETLVVKAFGDMGQTARLRLIRVRFIAGHSSCELRRYLDSVPPEIPIRDVVDRCRVWGGGGATRITVPRKGVAAGTRDPSV